jgi:hypothetical protein
MINQSLYFLDGTQFSNGYERIVHGGRGAYVELTKEQIVVSLKSHFNTKVPDEIIPEPFYYHWLEPFGRKEKIYWQIRTVKYADYKTGYYYISPNLLMPFEEINPKIIRLF